MQSDILNAPLLKVKSLESKFDTNVFSNSLIILLNDNVAEARILQQLHYWTYAQYGVVIDGIRWFYKPLREWLSEVLAGLTEWKLRKAIASLLSKDLIRREKLYVKHHQIKHDNPYWHPKNQTYYYSVNYDKLQELIDAVEGVDRAESTENVRIEDFTNLSSEDSADTKFCDLSQNKTDLTSIENYPEIKSHPTLPCESKNLKPIDQEKSHSYSDSLKTEEINSANLPTISPEAKVPQFDEKVNQNISTNRLPVQKKAEQPVARPKVKTASGTKSVSKRMKSAPWKDEGQFKRFYRALIQALPIVANARSPQGLAQVIIRQLRSGIPHTYWDDFVAGLPIGSSTKPEWEVEPGVPYPMFVEYLTEKIIKGNNTQSSEQARNEVFRILSQPRQASAFWGQFKRSVVNVSQQVERDRALGVSNPHTPVWTRERIEPSIEEAAAAGDTIRSVNGSTQIAIEAVKNPQLKSQDSSIPPSPELPAPDSTVPDPTADPWTEGDRVCEASPKESASDQHPQPSLRELLEERNILGYTKPIPKVEPAELQAEQQQEDRQKLNRKTHISQMSVAEINELLGDPITRQELTPQIIIDDKFDIITDYLGQILAVKLKPRYLEPEPGKEEF
ncbi:MAG: hypothetical protein AAFY50_19395 [Cyanobacteria bacterium J06648_1]